MRVTTQMLNAASIKAGVPINSISLLDFIKTDKNTTASSLLNALNGTSSTSTTSKSTYEQLKESADALEDSASVLTSEEEDNIFETAKTEGNTIEVKNQVKEFISSYNDLIKKLIKSSTTSSLNSYYKQMLAELYTDNKTSLTDIGITADNSGLLSLDNEKFSEVDIDTLEKALGSDSSFITKTSYIASRVSNNAETNLESISSLYSTSGQSYSTYSSSKYNTLR
jgi:hypothetical protein